MELGLSLGEVALAKTFSPARKRGLGGGAELRLGFSVGLERETAAEEEPTAAENDTAADSPVQLDLLPSSPLPRSPSSHSLVHPWPKPASDSSASQTGKKLCFSKEQSALLEESFREHKFLNYKQKIALAKQLNVRLRQVEVWFQNRRTRAKLKQTEVDCEYFKSCCDRLTEENRRLHKELQELRALKTSHPLTVSPSCERVATAATASSSAGAPPVRRRLSAL